MSDRPKLPRSIVVLNIIMIVGREDIPCSFCGFYMAEILTRNTVDIGVFFFRIIHKKCSNDKIVVFLNKKIIA